MLHYYHSLTSLHPYRYDLWVIFQTSGLCGSRPGALCKLDELWIWAAQGTHGHSWSSLACVWQVHTSAFRTFALGLCVSVDALFLSDSWGDVPVMFVMQGDAGLQDTIKFRGRRPTLVKSLQKASFCKQLYKHFIETVLHRDGKARGGRRFTTWIRSHLFTNGV